MENSILWIISSSLCEKEMKRNLIKEFGGHFVIKVEEGWCVNDCDKVLKI